jgi:Ca2+/Na+ antiporter
MDKGISLSELKFTNRDIGIFGVFAVLIMVFFLFRETFSHNPLVLILFMGVGLVYAILASEKAVGGMDAVGKKAKLTPYVSGVLSSLASNSPELVIGFFAILSGKVEFAIAFIIIATGFNILMLGLLILIGNFYRKESITIPPEVMEIEIPIVRVAIVFVGSIFVLGIVLFAVEAIEIATHIEAGIPFLPYEAAVLMVVVYLFYLFFIIRHNLRQHAQSTSKDRSSSDQAEIKRGFLIFILVLAFAAIFFAGEMISSSVELFLESSQQIGISVNEFQLAFFIGAAASIPEHAIALLAVRHEGGIELGLGNLIAGSMQNLLLMTGLVALFSFVGAILGIPGNDIRGIPLIHFIEGETPVPFLLVQYGFAWLLLFLIKSSMTDDQKLDIYEGFAITIAQVFVFIIFLRGILSL